MSKLIGTNPNQVPSNADLGTAAFMDKKEFLLSKGSEMSAINAVIPKTAVDVFIYDTTKDSDGGAWRKRVQHTSWYNEILNTTTRGSRREFPCVAVIVAETNKVTIYDGDDPSLSMWMVFNGATYSMLSNTHNGITGATMKDGNLVVISVSGYNHGGVSVINFISDYAYLKTAGYTRENDTGIVNRGNAFYGSAGSLYIVNNNVRDVAITVLPNAPIDSVTGLPVPTIAIATDGGISLINDNGVIVNYTNTQDSSTFNFCDNVFFRGDGAMVWQADSTGNSAAERFTRVVHVPRKSGTFVESVVVGSSALDEFYAPNQYASALRYLQTPTGVLASSPHGKAGFAAGQGQGLNIISPNRDTPTEGLINYITSDYNTGWMHGDIKLATLSDTDATNVTGAELVTNGTFASDTSWTKGTGWTISGGTAVASSVASGVKIESTAFTVTAGYYTIALDVTTSASTYYYGILGATNAGTSIKSTQGTVSITVYLNAGSHYAYIGAWSSGLSGTFDNFSVRLAEEDRSYNGNGLQTFGTITKTAVATGAELVAYSGFSASNYLQQPYNSDLDFGTGDFSIAGWIKPVASSSVQTLLNRKKLDASGTPIEFGINSDETPYLYTGSGATPLSGKPLPVGTWLHIVAVRQGGFYGIYINGELFNSNTGQNVNNVSNTDAPMVIGAYMTNGGRQYPWQGSLALLRISATAPTTEQIKKMYNDEKHLFQENAKATLYGTSNSVTALAYDDDTELLHVGTSAGRSDFHGLRRINNTTRAIGTAISAVDGFIVEE